MFITSETGIKYNLDEKGTVSISYIYMLDADYSPLFKTIIEKNGSEYKFIDGDEKRRMRLRRFKSGGNVTMNTILMTMEELDEDDISRIVTIKRRY